MILNRRLISTIDRTFVRQIRTAIRPVIASRAIYGLLPALSSFFALHFLPSVFKPNMAKMRGKRWERGPDHYNARGGAEQKKQDRRERSAIQRILPVIVLTLSLRLRVSAREFPFPKSDALAVRCYS